MAKDQAGFFSFMRSGQCVRHSEIYTQAAQETENYPEDAIIVLADKFGQQDGDDVPALISGDRLKAVSAVQAVTVASWKSNIQRGILAHYS